MGLVVDSVARRQTVIRILLPSDVAFLRFPPPFLFDLVGRGILYGLKPRYLAHGILHAIPIAGVLGSKSLMMKPEPFIAAWWFC